MAPAAQLAFDVKHAFCRFTRTPTFALTAVAVLFPGIAANVTVFSMANAVLLQPLTFLEPERVLLFQTTSPAGAVSSASPGRRVAWASVRRVAGWSAFHHAEGCWGHRHRSSLRHRAELARGAEATGAERLTAAAGWTG